MRLTLAAVLLCFGCGSGSSRDRDAAPDAGPDAGDCPDGAMSFIDADGDGYPGTETPGCDGEDASTDCNDEDDAVHPGAPDPGCDGVDSDCDGTVDLEAGPPVRLDDDAYATIAEALAVAEDGATIRLCPATYPGNLQLDERSLTIEGVSADPRQATIDAAGAAQVVTAGPGSLTLRRVTLRGGRRDGTAGLEADAMETLILDSVVLEDNRSAGGAAALYARVDRVEIRNCLFRGNVGEDALSNTAFVFAPNVAIEDSTFEDNEADIGGGIYVLVPGATTADVEVARTAFRRNRARGASALDLGTNADAGRLVVVDSLFEDNVASEFAPALLITGYVDAVDVAISVEGGRIVRNEGGTSYSEAVRIDGFSDVTFTGVDFGEGDDENVGGDVSECEESFGTGASFVYDPGERTCT